MGKNIRKITIINAHWNNRGDEAALLAIVNGLKENYPNAKVSILFKDDKTIHQFPKIENIEISISKFNAKIWDIWLTTFSRGIFGFNKKLKNTIRIITKTDLIVYSPGGSVINNRFFWRKQMEYLVPFICAKFYNIPLFIAAPSIGPFDKSLPNRVLKSFLKVPKLFIVREEISKEYLKQIGITNNIITTIDSAFYDEINIEKNQEKLNNYLPLKEYLNRYKKTIGFTITDFRWHVKYNKDKELSETINKTFRKLIEKLQDQGYGIVFIPQLFANQNDYNYMDSFSNKETFILKDTYNTYFQQFIISKLYAVIGMRYHSNIFSAKVKTPFIPIIYEEKMEGFINMANLNDYAVFLDKLSFEQLEKKFRLLQNNYIKIKETLSDSSSLYKKQATKTIKLLGMYK